LLFALASPDELNIRALTTVAGNVRLDKTSRNARLAASGRGARTFRFTPAPKPLMRTPIYAENIHGKEGLSGVTVHEPKKGLAEGNAVNYLIDTLKKPSPTASPSPCWGRRPTWRWR
jgi:purine nucleosidase